MKFYKINQVLNFIWKRQGMETISLVFDVLRKTLRPKIFALIESINIGQEQVRIKVKGGSVEKAEIMLHKDEIIDNLNEVFGSERFKKLLVD